MEYVVETPGQLPRFHTFASKAEARRFIAKALRKLSWVNLFSTDTKRPGSKIRQTIRSASEFGSMDRAQANIWLVAILETLDEIDPASEMSLFLPLQTKGASIDDWQVIREILVAGGLATIKGNLVTITEKGRTIAQRSRQWRAERGLKGIPRKRRQ